MPSIRRFNNERQQYGHSPHNRNLKINKHIDNKETLRRMQELPTQDTGNNNGIMQACRDIPNQSYRVLSITSASTTGKNNAAPWRFCAS
ncbi:3609_t:CDS:2 [Funneliformis mosseae]|uniref:3609_t:CDS:1 n=1 Tax=Funneliformis mosseae TaxID=27381 RepID=A0A9N8Z3A1_FUNMO|nr:3609_t:CDS:2 [Funneliformis mosseae]